MYADLTDVATRLGRTPEGAEAAQITAWIEDVEGLIAERIPTLADLAADPDYARRLRAIICAVVIRKVDNPTGKLQERIDDYSYGLSADVVRTSDLTLTDAEWARLSPTSASGAWSIIPARESPPW